MLSPTLNPKLKPYFMTQEDLRAGKLYQRCFLGMMQTFAQQAAKGYGAKESWEYAWKYWPESLALDGDDLRLFHDLVAILEEDRSLKVDFVIGGEERSATICWRSEDRYPYAT